MKFKGKVWKFGSNIDTDGIIPARYLNSSDPKELSSHCMEEIDPQFAKKVKKGDIIVANRNFGCGSSREHAPIAIKAAGLSCVIAKSFARIFYRNCFNMGLPILESSTIYDEVEEGDEIEVDLKKGTIFNVTRGTEFHAQPIPPFMQELVQDGGLMKHVAKQRR